MLNSPNFKFHLPRENSIDKTSFLIICGGSSGKNFLTEKFVIRKNNKQIHLINFRKRWNPVSFNNGKTLLPIFVMARIGSFI